MKRVIVFVQIGDELVRLSGKSFRSISSERMMHERRFERVPVVEAVVIPGFALHAAKWPS